MAKKDEKSPEAEEGTKKKKKYEEVNPDHMKLVNAIMKQHKDTFSDILPSGLCVLSCYGYNKAKWLGRCRGIRPPYDALIPDVTYLIEVNEDRINGLGYYEDPDKKALKMLLYHELRHIPNGGTDPESKQYKKIAKHDLLEFSDCLRLAGVQGPIDWACAAPEDLPDILTVDDLYEQD